MDFNGKISAIGELKVAVNSKTGAEFSTRSIVLAKQHQYYSSEGTKVAQNEYVFELSNEQAVNFSLPVGTNVSVRYGAKVVQAGGNFYEHKRIYSIELV